MRNKSLWFAGVLLVSFVSAGWMLAGDAAQWAITADIAESCNCNPACPCVFGSKSTNEHCEGSRLVEIKKGYFGGVRLDGVPVVIAFRMGGYVEYYVDDRATDEQFDAAVELMKHTFAPMAEWGVLATHKVPVSVERTASRVKFTTPETTVDLEIMQGAGGKPVKVHDLPAEFLRDYTQYVSKENSHKDERHEFGYSGTNGFTSKLKTKG